MGSTNLILILLIYQTRALCSLQYLYIIYGGYSLGSYDNIISRDINYIRSRVHVPTQHFIHNWWR